MSITLHYIDVPEYAPGTLKTEGEELGTCRLEQLSAGGEDKAWATLEVGGWPLDGSRILPSMEELPALLNRETSGGCSGALGAAKLGNLKISHGVFAFLSIPAVELSLNNEVSANGITFWFSDASNTWCSRMILYWYRGTKLLETHEVFPDKPCWTLHKRVEGFDRVRVEFLEMNRPGVLLKMRKLQLGRTLVFNREQIRSVRLINEADPSLSKLTVDTMTVELFSLEDLELAPQQRQKMQLYRDGKLLANHGIREFSRQGRQSFIFSCQSPVGDLESSFLGGIYQGKDAEKLLREVLGDVELELDPLLRGQKVTGYLPVCTRREALQQIAFAIGGVVSTRSTPGVRIGTIPSFVTGNFSAQSVFEGGTVTTEPIPSRVEVVAHSFTPERGVQVLLEGEAIDDSDLLLTFSQPYCDYEITGGQILESGANFVRISGQGSVTLKAKPYNHNKIRYIRKAATEGSDNNRVETVEDATLIHSGNASAIADRLLRISSLRQTLRNTVAAKEQFAGQKVVIPTSWDEHMQGYITSMSSVFTQGGHTAEITVTGMLQQPEKSIAYAGEVWSGSWEVTAWI